MGMFSWDCNACGFSLRECRNCSEGNWMSKGVCLTPDGSRVIGHYNAYGQLGEYNLVDQIGKFAIYHHACWEVMGRPEYDRPSHHSRDQGFCHAMHGQPFPLPTKEWIEKARMWQSVERVLNAYAQLLCEIDHDREKGYWDSLKPERQLALCNAYTAERNARKARWDVAWSEYLRSTDENAVDPPKEPDPKTFQFDGIVFDYMWLGHFVAMAKRDR
jgi:hypothetical protein